MITSWQDEMRHAITKAEALSEIISKEIPTNKYKIFIPASLMARILKEGVDSSLGKQFIPSENENLPEGLWDPIGDQICSPMSQLVHRYPSRALYLSTSVCPVSCRFCFRKNELESPMDLFKTNKDQVLNYVKDHPEIMEIIFSGGDPLSLSDEKLFNEGLSFLSVEHVQYLRFHTRMPIIIPQRIDQNFLMTFEKLTLEGSRWGKKIIFVIHTNHASEWDATVIEAVEKLKKLNVIILAQTVLLKEINDTVAGLKNLITLLDRLKIRSYYLHHPDRVRGGMHFYVDLEKGRRIYSQLRQELPGWMLPTYIIDIPEGKGKIPAFNAEDFSFSGTLVDHTGQKWKY